MPFVKLIPKFNCGRTGDKHVFYCLCAIIAYWATARIAYIHSVQGKLVGRILCSILN